MASKTKVAICGAGGLGSYFVDEFFSRDDLFEVVVLARKENKELTDKGINVIVVDFNSVDQLTAALQGVSALISALFSYNVEECVRIYKNLIQACRQAGVKRFVPGEWAGDASQPVTLDLYLAKKLVREILENCGLEYTLEANGLFMDYLLPKGAKKYAKDVVIPVNPELGTASIPGNGDEKLTVTTCEDIAKSLVELVLYQGKWPKYLQIAGETTSWNEILRKAEKITGKKFQVEYKSKEELEKIIQTSNDDMKKFYAQVDLGYAEGILGLPKSQESEDILKNVKFTTVEELLEKAYKKN